MWRIDIYWTVSCGRSCHESSILDQIQTSKCTKKVCGRDALFYHTQPPNLISTASAHDHRSMGWLTVWCMCACRLFLCAEMEEKKPVYQTRAKRSAEKPHEEETPMKRTKKVPKSRIDCRHCSGVLDHTTTKDEIHFYPCMDRLHKVCGLELMLLAQVQQTAGSNPIKCPVCDEALDAWSFIPAGVASAPRRVRFTSPPQIAPPRTNSGNRRSYDHAGRSVAQEFHVNGGELTQCETDFVKLPADIQAHSAYLRFMVVTSSSAATSTQCTD